MSDVRALILNDLMHAGHTGRELDALVDTLTLLVEALEPGWVVDPHMVSADVRVVEAAADHVEGNLT